MAAAPQKSSQSNSSPFANSIRSGSYIFFNPAAKQTNPRSISQLTWLDGATGKAAAIAKFAGKDNTQVKLYWDRDLSGTLNSSEAKTPIGHFSLSPTLSKRLWAEFGMQQGLWSADQITGKGTITFNTTTKIAIQFTDKSFLKQATRQLAATPELTKFDNTYNTIINGLENASSMLDSGNINGMLNSMNDLAKFAQTIS